MVTFPKPVATDLDALLPAVIAGVANERGLELVWLPPLNGVEHAAVARYWRGGLVRRLRRIVDAILHQRDLRAARH